MKDEMSKQLEGIAPDTLVKVSAITSEGLLTDEDKQRFQTEFRSTELLNFGRTFVVVLPRRYVEQLEAMPIVSKIVAISEKIEIVQ